MIRAVLGTGGRPPLEATGIETHRKLALLDETVAEPLKRHDSPLTRQLWKHLHRAVVRSRRIGDMVTRLGRFVKRAARVVLCSEPQRGTADIHLSPRSVEARRRCVVHAAAGNVQLPKLETGEPFHPVGMVG